MTVSRGGVRLSVEALERRDTPSRLSVALDNIVAQQFTATGTPAHGSFKYKYGPAAYESDTVPTYITDTYFGAYSCLALIQQRYDEPGESADADDRVGWWVDWNLRNVAGDGTFVRRFYRADGGVPVSTPTETPTDAHDSDASLLLTVANAYAQAGYPTSILTAGGVRAKFEAVAGKLLSLQQPDGLTWAKADYPVKFLMDGCESYAGFLAMAQLELAVWDDPTQAAVYSAAAARVKQGILTTLYDTGTGLFKPSDVGQLDLQKLYPAYGITFPALLGVLDLNQPGDLTTARRQVQAVNDYWNGVDRRDWQTQVIRGVEDMGYTDPNFPPGNYFATPLLYSPLLSGNVTESTTFTGTVYDAYYPSGATTPQYTDMTIADNAWLALALGAIDGNPAISNLSVTGTAAADTFIVGTTPTRGTGSITLSYNGGIPQAYTGVTAISVSGGAGSDSLTVYAPVGTALVSGAVSFAGGTARGETNSLTVFAQGQSGFTTGTALGVGNLFTMQFTGATKVSLNGASAVNALTGPDTVSRAALPSGLSANERWLSRVYTDVLARPLDAGGRAYWLNLLAAGHSRAAVLAGVSGSLEAHILKVQRWYSLYLGRAAVIDPNNGWVQLLSGGMSEENVISGILGSDEFFNRAQALFTGTANERYVKALYRFLLHRDPADVSFWANELNTTARQTVALGFLYSTEYRIYQCQGAFVTYLQRPSDTFGVNFYLNGGMGAGMAGLRTFVLSSLEYSLL